jgi:pyroglutamyl-peptidase
MVKKKALIFGFEPFDDYKENPSESIARRLDGLKVGGTKVRSHILPVDHAKVEDEIIARLDGHEPAIVLGLGLAAGRSKLSVEKVAINYLPAPPGNRRHKSIRPGRIDALAPDGIFANIDPERIVEVLSRRGIPASLSLSAGSYLCNHAMFIIVREAARRGMKGGFIHLPCDERLASMLRTDNCPSMQLDTMENGIRITLECLLEDRSRTRTD